MVTLDQVLRSVKATFGKCANLLLDCCYAGNWALDIKRYGNRNRGWTIGVNAACYPHMVAYDTPKGGMFTCLLAQKQLGEEVSGSCHWCFSMMNENGFSIKYMEASRKLK